ncbi:uncharacterized protein SCHCODRAFT_02670817 [Schizophyllum commune H4-8]|uniref:uncharacterized protein n=1 Tax=Schizophyllum commune (strain H4-8 / FGSC 9210) TaxID=578458 RepID=UPI0021608EC7|nr:uncharacterized protein SCHCODRAFT_02670817 [Schizophyllum commune H4-8]KAI5888143.1 hypothetical protein SCHCODRAFT_02670817 [Schizophyllum commune H4-8]
MGGSKVATSDSRSACCVAQACGASVRSGKFDAQGPQSSDTSRRPSGCLKCRGGVHGLCQSRAVAWMIDGLSRGALTAGRRYFMAPSSSSRRTLGMTPIHASPHFARGASQSFSVVSTSLQRRM